MSLSKAFSSGNMSQAYHTKLRYFKPQDNLILKSKFLDFSIKLDLFHFKEGAHISYVILPACKVMKKIFERKIKGLLYW